MKKCLIEVFFLIFINAAHFYLKRIPFSKSRYPYNKSTVMTFKFG